jgi:3-hydroxyacyl-CoA dehydrogenase
MAWQPPVIGTRPVVVLGASVLGRRIACTFVTGGYNVHLVDPSPKAREAAVRYIDENRQHYANNLPNRAGILQYGSYAAFGDAAAAVGKAWLLVEAGVGEMELNLDAFTKIDAAAPADCILAFNSSLFKTSPTLSKDAKQEWRRMICDIRFAMPPNDCTVELTTDGEADPAVFTFLSDLLTQCGMLTATARKESTR